MLQHGHVTWALVATGGWEVDLGREDIEFVKDHDTRQAF